jgi:hypothetical protein
MLSQHLREWLRGSTINLIILTVLTEILNQHRSSVRDTTGQFYSLDPVIYEELIPHIGIPVDYVNLPQNISVKARIGL